MKEKQHYQIATKLASEGYVAKAPASVVEGKKAKLAEFADQLAKIKANMDRLQRFNLLVI
nr:hypothetical protein [Acinetobacter sp. UBA6526]